ncbi:PDZ domain-containing protein [Alkalicoccus urumqiensis]|uniref:PDZ domain-containing protein n=1 Tax=Alkalicoccus urumqiensis TaxID=1548213 RepID=A0A2P6MH45_ALKUR|nr:PDZ domain-containing protein [Alkalicoccus urumqiensis]PRO65606.1 hypothetical protein C6I21_08765 [Alkalicoccus urumqiensis]
MEEVFSALGRLFLHPLTYIAAAAVFWFHLQRVKRERKAFHTRVYDAADGLLSPLSAALAAGLLLSAAILLLGLELPAAVIPFMTVVWLLQVPFKHARWYSMTVTFALLLTVVPFLPASGSGWAWLDTQLEALQTVSLPSLGAFLLLLAAAEAMLISIDGYRQPSPDLKKSSRGKLVGMHRPQRLWILPAAVLLPAGGWEAGAWWPLLDWHSPSFGLLLLPVVLGFQLAAQARYPAEACRRAGGRMLGAVLILALLFIAVLVYLPEWLFLLGPAVLLVREVLFLSLERADSHHTSLFTVREKGLAVVHVLPKSTAAKMELTTGDIIMKVNGRDVATQREFYEALQISPAFAKLEVIDTEGEKRLTQASIYENDHYLIGCLFIPDDEGMTLSLKGMRSASVVHQDREELRRAEEKQKEAREEKEAYDEGRAYGQAAGMQDYVQNRKQREKDRYTKK